MPHRNRQYYFLLIILTIGLGLFSRTAYIPESIYPYLGDALYTLMIFFIVGILFPYLPSHKTFLWSVGICFLIEFSQLYQTEWILALRQTRIGSLVLGHSFLWSDLLAYLGGGLLGFLIEKKLFSKIFYK